MLTRLLSSLPAILLLAVAAATVWMLQQENVKEMPELTKQPKHEPDYRVENFTILSMNEQGFIKAVLSGQQMQHYPDTDTSDIAHPLHVSLTYQRAQQGLVANPPISVSSLSAIVNADGSEIALHDKAQIVRAADLMQNKPQMTLSSAYMLLKPDDDVIESDQLTHLTHGSTFLSGQQFYLNNIKREVKLMGKVQGQLVGDSTTNTSQPAQP